MKDDSLADTQQDGYEMKLSQDEMMKAANDYAAKCAALKEPVNKYNEKQKEYFQCEICNQPDPNINLVCQNCKGMVHPKHEMKRGGYCSKCDTVWCAPGKCRCVGISENVYEREVWNRAIEAAAEVAEINSAADIRKLKK